MVLHMLLPISFFYIPVIIKRMFTKVIANKLESQLVILHEWTFFGRHMFFLVNQKPVVDLTSICFICTDIYVEHERIDLARRVLKGVRVGSRLVTIVGDRQSSSVCWKRR